MQFKITVFLFDTKFPLIPEIRKIFDTYVFLGFEN